MPAAARAVGVPNVVAPVLVAPVLAAPNVVAPVLAAPIVVAPVLAARIVAAPVLAARIVVAPVLVAFLVLALLGGAANLRAQSVDAVVPPAYAAAEAPGVEFWALSPFDARRQVLIDGRYCASLSMSLLSAVSVRRNMGVGDTLRGGKLQVSLWLSNATAGVRADEPSPRFAVNRGPDHQRLFHGLVDLRDAPAAPVVPAPWQAPWAVTLPFTRPFLYRGGTLCVETETRVSSASTNQPWWTIDAIVADPVGTVQRRGTSCIAAAPGQPAGAEPLTLAAGATAVFWLRAPSAAGVAACLLGVDDRAFGPLPLPLDLWQFGAPGCTLYNDVVVARAMPVPPATKGGGGLVVLELPVPVQAAMAGGTLFTQWLVPDASVVPLGYGFSNGVMATLGAPRAPFGYGWVEAVDLTAATGRVLFGRMPVLGFTRGP